MKGKRQIAIERHCENCSQVFFQQGSGRAARLCNECKGKLLKPSLRPTKREEKVQAAETDTEFSRSETEDLRKRLRFAGWGEIASIPRTLDFFRALKRQAERSLYFFTKYIFGAADLTDHLHKPVCDWLQDMSISRRKLCMLPVVHLKTTMCSHSFPLWALIQPSDENLLFSGMAGVDLRILLHGETTPKAIENLAVIRQHAESNRLMRHLWPRVFWADPNNEAPTWGANALTFKRTGTRFYAEPTLTAIGVGTGLEQRHYDIIIIDDIATFEAALSEIVMNRAKMRRKALFSRLNDPVRSIELGVGTHWTPTDVYVEWKKDPGVSVMIRSAIENGEPIWPERHPLDVLLARQAEEGMGKVLFSANYMNNPLNAAFTAMDWQEVRECRIENGYIVFEREEQDVSLANRMVAGGKFPSAWWGRRSEFSRGTPLDRLYPARDREDEETDEQRELRLLARLERKLSAAQEGSNDWARLSELFARQRQNAKERGLLN